ncbi:hypothetical protein [Streptomyces sp. NPDC002889]|uniref:hypothetical protein n=1 Tax=Streptomyces sp. NPDC002889 TaxID=3364669 RepID=UPI003677401B
MNRQRGRGRVMLAGLAAVCAVAVLAGQASAAGEPNPYTFDSEAKSVRGTAVNSDGPPLEAGSTYRDTIKPDEKRYYRIDLDAKSNAYVSAVAVPKLGTKVAYPDKLEVSIEDRSGTKCSSHDAMFGSATYPRPVAAYAGRRIDPKNTNCQEAGAYYVLLQRTSDPTSTPEPWDVEIRFASEPGLKTGAGTQAPENWPSASPAAPAGGPQKRHGGTSFLDATSLKEGEWQDEIAPGRTLFYRVPVNWGQQLFASADLGTSPTGDASGSVSNAFVLALHNPARGFVDDESSVFYDGKQKSIALEPLPPVAYENRYDSNDSTSAMRFAGWYYLSVTLSPEIAEEYGKKPLHLTLRVNVEGEAKSGPQYAGPAGDFQVTGEDREAADSGRSAPEAAKSDTMKLVAAAGIGAGAVLILGLGAWVLLARRRTPAFVEPAPFPAQAQGYGQGYAQDMTPAYGPGPAQPGYGYPPVQGPHQDQARSQGYGPGPYGPPPAQ